MKHCYKCEGTEQLSLKRRAKYGNPESDLYICRTCRREASREYTANRTSEAEVAIDWEWWDRALTSYRKVLELRT